MSNRPHSRKLERGGNGHGFERGTKFTMGSSGKINNKKYLSQVA